VLRGTKVDLRAVEPYDIPTLTRWFNDPDVMLYWGRPGNTVSQAEVEARERADATRGNSRKYIVQTKEGEAIGQIDYYDLDWQNRSAWISVMLGEKEYWSGGYGTDAIRTLLTYLFRQLGMRRVALTVHESNKRAQRSYQKNGFVAEGVLRDWAHFDGRWENGILMAVLRDDFEGSDGG
jgi:RimJ/RimL family protein N-acetyltransferase